MFFDRDRKQVPHKVITGGQNVRVTVRFGDLSNKIYFQNVFRAVTGVVDFLEWGVKLRTLAAFALMQ